MGVLRLKNDQKTTNPPHSDQLIVGEIAINAVTGKLYTKLVNGSIVEFVGKQVCFSKIPGITFDAINNFCCNGDILNVKVIDLTIDGNYIFELEDLSGNDVTYTINTPIYTEYDYTDTSTNNVIPLKEAVIPVTLSISGAKNLTILKFKILNYNSSSELIELTSRTITISCGNC